MQLDNIFRCDRGHTYDITKEGYVNLLLVNQKASLAPGDSKEMLAARRAFLEKGYYDPLSDKINAIVAAKSDALLQYGKSFTIIDTGCGEGYYLQRLKRYMDLRNPSHAAQCFGLDISKEAIKMAAKKYKEIRFVVASINKVIPFADDSVDILLNIFAPKNTAEFARTLSLNGTGLIVIPTERHLSQLHFALGLSAIKGSKDSLLLKDLEDEFIAESFQTVDYTLTLPGEDIVSLIQMIPTYWRVSEEMWAMAHEIESLEVDFSFAILPIHKIPITVSA